MAILPATVVTWIAIIVAIHAIPDYRFTFTTGTDPLAATDAQMYVTITGTEGEQTFYFDGSGSAFDVGATDVFERNGPNVGKLGEMIVGHDGTGIGSEYDLQELTIDVYDSSTHFVNSYTVTCSEPQCLIFHPNTLPATSQVPPDLDMTQWNPWGPCTPCPNGRRQRYRPCLAEYPQFGLTCITGQKPEEMNCLCDCGTPTDDGSSKDAFFTTPPKTEVGSNVEYQCNHGKKWSNAAASLFFTCSDLLVWAAVDNATKTAYDHGCVDCAVVPPITDAVYDPHDNPTTIHTEAAFNCDSGKVLPGGSGTATMKCVWDEDVDTHKWVTSTGTINISVSSVYDWQIQLNGGEWQAWATPQCSVPPPVLGDWEQWSSCTCATGVQTRDRECIQEFPGSTCADASPPERRQCGCSMTESKFKSNKELKEGRLLHSTIYSKPSRSSVECAHSCGLLPTCLSFNYDKARKECELNMNTAGSNPANFDVDEDWTHFIRA